MTQLNHALSPTAGIGASLSLHRMAARDPGLSTWMQGGGLYGYKDIGLLPLTLSGHASRLKADERLFIYPEVREDELLRAQLGAVVRKITYRGFAPQIRLVAERNRSSIEVYDYKRRAVEFGLTRAF